MRLHDPDFEQRTRDSFTQQPAMVTLGVGIESVAAGRVVLLMPHRADPTQQHGFLHAGMVATALDSACGYAAFTLMPAGAGVLTIEFKINLLAPARGALFEIRGRVVKAGRTINVCEASAIARETGSLVCTMTATVMTIVDRPGISG